MSGLCVCAFPLPGNLGTWTAATWALPVTQHAPALITVSGSISPSSHWLEPGHASAYWQTKHTHTHTETHTHTQTETNRPLCVSSQSCSPPADQTHSSRASDQSTAHFVSSSFLRDFTEFEKRQKSDGFLKIDFLCSRLSLICGNKRWLHEQE